MSKKGIDKILVSQWQGEITQSFTDIIEKYYASCSDPYSTTLSLVKIMPDFKTSTEKTLSFAIMETFAIWVSYHKPKLCGSLTLDKQIHALKTATLPDSMGLYAPVTEAYELIKSKEPLLKSLKGMIVKGEFEKVSYWVPLLDVESFFDVESFAIPLWLSNNTKAYENCLNNCPSYKLPMVRFLDDLLGRYDTYSYLMETVVRLNVARTEKTKEIIKRLSTWQTIAKAIRKLVDNYDSVPNLKNNDTINGIRFFSHSYINRMMSCEAFTERMEEVCTNSTYKRVLLEYLKVHSYKDYLIWCEHFSEIPEQPPSKPKKISPEYEGKYYTLNKNIPLIIIDTLDGMVNLNKNLALEKIVGMDLETKASTGFPNKLAIFQIATQKYVYLIDCIRLAAYDIVWKDFRCHVMRNSNLIKLVFGGSSDSASLKKFPPLSQDKFSENGFLDLQNLWNNLKTESGFSLNFEDSKHDKKCSLSHLAHCCFGTYLDKGEQLSDWERRPLREAQKLYAASDAYCLLEIFNVILKRSNECNIQLGKYLPGGVKLNDFYRNKGTEFCYNCYENDHNFVQCPIRLNVLAYTNNIFLQLHVTLKKFVGEYNKLISSIKQKGDGLKKLFLCGTYKSPCYTMENNCSRNFIKRSVIQTLLDDITNFTLYLGKLDDTYEMSYHSLENVLDLYDDIKEHVHSIKRYVNRQEIKFNRMFNDCSVDLKECEYGQCSYCMMKGHNDVECEQFYSHLSEIKNMQASLSLEIDECNKIPI